LRTHPNLTAVGFDLPVTRQRFEDYTATVGVADRVRFHPGDFFRDPLPEADVVVLSNGLYNWNLAQKHELITKTYESLVDEERHDPLSLLASLSMNLVLATAPFLLARSAGNGCTPVGSGRSVSNNSPAPGRWS
jgi:hypothetical protein